MIMYQRQPHAASTEKSQSTALAESRSRTPLSSTPSDPIKSPSLPPDLDPKETEQNDLEEKLLAAQAAQASYEKAKTNRRSTTGMLQSYMAKATRAKAAYEKAKGRGGGLIVEDEQLE